MTDEMKNIFFSPKFYNIFQKHDWVILSSFENNYHFNYQGEIADYYLMVYNNYDSIKFDYTLDIEVPKDKINELLKLMNFINQNTQNGCFIYDLEANNIKFYVNQQYPVKLKNMIIEDVIEENLNITNYLFRYFTLATHNLIYAEKIDQSYIELMFMEIKGHA